DRGPARGTDGDAELDLGQVRRRRTRERAVSGVPTHELGTDLVEAEAQPFEPAPQDSVRGHGLLDGIRPGVDQSTDGLVAGAVGDRDLELVGRWPPLDAVHADAVGADLLEADGGEVGDHVGGDVLPRIAHLVDKLFGARGDADAAARPLVLGYHTRAVRRGFDAWSNDVVQIRDRMN